MGDRKKRKQQVAHFIALATTTTTTATPTTATTAAAPSSFPTQHCVELLEAPEKSIERRVTICECGGLGCDENGDASEELGAV